MDGIYEYELVELDGAWYWRWLDADEDDLDGPYATQGRAEQMAEAVVSEARYGW